MFNAGPGALAFEELNIMVSESAGPAILCVELDLSSAAGDLGCDVTVTLYIIDGTNAGSYYLCKVV